VGADGKTVVWARAPVIAPVFALAAVSLFLLVGPAEPLLFTRGELGPLALLSLLTCHLAHWSLEHVLWDAAVFALVGSWCERLDRRAFAAFLGIAAVAIPPIVLLARPEITSYAGLSGLDVGALVLAVGLSLRRGDLRRQLPVLLLGVGVVAKVVYELLAGHTMLFDSSADFVPLPLAHLIGALVGAAVVAARVVKTARLGHNRA
jgi:rhomboid family GlyGly-CTERM serine protease